MIGDLLQPTHLIFVLLIALLVLGPKRLPEVGRSLGRGLRDFKDALSGEDREPPTTLNASAATSTAAEPPAPATSTPTHEPAEHAG